MIERQLPTDDTFGAARLGERELPPGEARFEGSNGGLDRSFGLKSWIEDMTSDALARREQPTITPSDKAYGWTIGCLLGFAAYLVFNSVARAGAHDLSVSLLAGVAAALIAGAAAYRWASRAKARWRREGASPRE